MSNYAITEANVRCSVTPKRGRAGVDITAGQALAIAADGDLELFDSNSGTAELREFAGFAVCGAKANQPILYVKEDPLFTPGCTLAVGDTIIGSATPGAICPDSDAATGWFKTILGTAISTTQMKLAPLASGAAKA